MCHCRFVFFGSNAVGQRFFHFNFYPRSRRLPFKPKVAGVVIPGYVVMMPLGMAVSNKWSHGRVAGLSQQA